MAIFRHIFWSCNLLILDYLRRVFPTPRVFPTLLLYHFCFNFILFEYTGHVMLILILIDVQYSQKTVFRFEKGSDYQNHSWGSHHSVKKSSLSKISDPPTGIYPHPSLLFGKLWTMSIPKVTFSFPDTMYEHAKNQLNSFVLNVTTHYRAPWPKRLHPYLTMSIQYLLK